MKMQRERCRRSDGQIAEGTEERWGRGASVVGAVGILNAGAGILLQGESLLVGRVEDNSSQG